MFEKYGVNYPLQNKEIMKKTQETCLKKYGVRNPLLSVDIQRKRMGTIKDMYGVEYPSQNKEIRQKTIETFIKRYGFVNPMQNPEIAKNLLKIATNQNHLFFRLDMKFHVKVTNLLLYRN